MPGGWPSGHTRREIKKFFPPIRAGKRPAARRLLGFGAGVPLAGCSGLGYLRPASGRRAVGERRLSPPCSPVARLLRGPPHSVRRLRMRFLGRSVSTPARGQTGRWNTRQTPFLPFPDPRKPHFLFFREAPVEALLIRPLRGLVGGVFSVAIGYVCWFSSRGFAKKPPRHWFIGSFATKDPGRVGIGFL